jgi:hypothetical protein
MTNSAAETVVAAVLLVVPIRPEMLAASETAVVSACISFSTVHLAELFVAVAGRMTMVILA